MKKLELIRKEENIRFFYCFLSGFLLGVLFANISRQYRVWDLESIEQLQISGKLSLEITGSDYFWYLFCKRFGQIWFFIPLGVTMLGTISIMGCCIWWGFLGGILMGAAVTQMGISGVGWLAAAIFPQIIFYFPAIILYFGTVYRMSEKYWKKIRQNTREYGKYILTCSGCLILILWGVLMEAYLNPVFLKKIGEFLQK